MSKLGEELECCDRLEKWKHWTESCGFSTCILYVMMSVPFLLWPSLWNTVLVWEAVVKAVFLPWWASDDTSASSGCEAFPLLCRRVSRHLIICSFGNRQEVLQSNWWWISALLGTEVKFKYGRCEWGGKALWHNWGHGGRSWLTLMTLSPGLDTPRKIKRDEPVKRLIGR